MSGENFTRTGVFATDDERKAVVMEFQSPAICEPGLFDFPDPWGMIDRLSVKHGLPETKTQRGMDLRTGEFLEFDGRSNCEILKGA